MHASFAQSAAKTLFDQPSLPFAPGFGGVSNPHILSVSGRHGGLRSPGTALECGPRLIHSVVAEAGLGRFVYLEGLSGRRYVFSSISAEQVSLYDQALFAVMEAERDGVRISKTAGDLRSVGGDLYVHLLDDDSGDGSDTLADLGAVTVS